MNTGKEKMPSRIIVIALGANLPSEAGTPAETIHAALAALKQNGITLAEVSPFYRTPAWPDPADPEFVNAVARIETALPPEGLIARLHAVEEQFGRMRGVRNAPRRLDIDLIDYEGRIEDGSPVLPHPRMQTRAFVLAPLRDVAPGWRHPVSGKTVETLLRELPDAGRSATRL
ncbi:MAG TPA: 2-amino-4-hydroxy-6-hydroxymethyldihydropteridine diphosphokinase [Rhizomicrobium sp.]|jgi:2-amino-4-hydroxy-6-hydroxymethyldihydropteridine diphosphokinase|nr:2-amino-4-hydroxy-6-hydroxymethyldihydropteridine diphosphokinase [Rhizomicrobium sp.]